MNEAEVVRGYSFGDWKLDIVRGSLIYDDQECFLRHQSLQVLRYFLEHPNTVIPKDELAAAIWDNNSVTDNALAQCIAEIRRELKDDRKNPRFIKTFPKIGYRFIAPVQAYGPPPAPAIQPLKTQTELQETLVKEIPDRAETASVEASSPIASRKLRWRCCRIGLFLAFPLIAFFGGLLHHSPPSKREQNSATSVLSPPTLVVFALSNTSGREDLDWLREGIADMVQIDLAHTGQWNVLSREKVHSLSGNKAGKLQTERASQLARTAGATAFLSGTISVAEQQIHIKIETRNANDGHLLGSDEVFLSDSRQTVAEASLLSNDIARHLGMSVNSTPSIAHMMTSNVEAYRYYSLGVEKAEHFQNAQAIELLQKAVKLDPDFAMAYARIGYASAVKDFEPAKGRPYLEKALRLSGRLPERDQLYIKAWYAISRSEYEQSIRVLQEIIAKYPAETEAYSLLARLLRGLERTQSAAAVLSDAIRKNPNAEELYNSYGLIQSALGQPSQAVSAYRQYVALAPQNPNAHDSLGMAYDQLGQYETAIAEYASALRLDPEFEPSIVHLGDTFYKQGRYQEALREYQRYIEITHNNDAKALGYGDIATVYLTLGKLQQARDAAIKEIHYNRNAVWNTIVLAMRTGQKKKILELQQQLFAALPNPERGSPSDIRTEFFYHGYIELKSGDAQGALSHFKAALQHLPPSSGIDMHEDCLANAYLELGMLPEAVAEYKRILQANPRYPLASYHLAQAYDRLNNKQEARKAFHDFLQASISADPSNPFVLEAKRNL